jgi:hypothetical protein
MRPPLETVVFDHNWDSVRRVMWGPGRDRAHRPALEAAARHLALLREEIEHDYGGCGSRAT